MGVVAVLPAQGCEELIRLEWGAIIRRKSTPMLPILLFPPPLRLEVIIRATALIISHFFKGIN